MDEIDVSDIPQAELLAELYNRAQVMGMGFLQRRAEPMTVEQAQALLDGRDAETDYGGSKAQDRGPNKPAYFDYVYGKPLKVSIDGKTLRAYLYDRDQGDGAAQRAVDAIRARKKAA